jgi:CBS domain-containing protein
MIEELNNTYIRFKQLEIADPKHAEIYLDCASSIFDLSKI